MILTLPPEMILSITYFLDEGSKWMLSSTNKYFRNTLYDKYENSPISVCVNKIKIVPGYTRLQDISIILLKDIYMPKILHYALLNNNIELFYHNITKYKYIKNLIPDFPISIIKDREDNRLWIGHINMDIDKQILMQTKVIDMKNIVVDKHHIIVKLNDINTWNLRFFISSLIRQINRTHIMYYNLKQIPLDKIKFKLDMETSVYTNNDYKIERVVRNNSMIYKKYQKIRFIFKINVINNDTCEPNLVVVEYSNLINKII